MPVGHGSNAPPLLASTHVRVYNSSSVRDWPHLNAAPGKGTTAMLEIRETFLSPRPRRNVCRANPLWMDIAIATAVWLFGAFLVGGPPLAVYGLALYIMPSGFVPELILGGSAAAWIAGLYLYGSR